MVNDNEGVERRGWADPFGSCDTSSTAFSLSNHLTQIAPWQMVPEDARRSDQSPLLEAQRRPWGRAARRATFAPFKKGRNR